MKIEVELTENQLIDILTNYLSERNDGIIKDKIIEAIMKIPLNKISEESRSYLYYKDESK